METDGERGEDCRAIIARAAVERFVDMFETRGHRDAMAGQQRPLRGTMGEAFERSEAMRRRELADRVHSGMKVERREARTGIADLGDAQTDLVPDVRERVGCHSSPPVERKLSQLR
jgi:hypothetical protein